MVLGKYYERLIEDLKKIIFRDHVPTPVDLDRVYDFAKNSLGHASIKDLRIQLGLSLEEFMRYYREYILQNYELIPGGEEGFIKGGVMYGIIRRKR
ncbi:PepK [Sulfolobus sp. S-194]|nr:PepK [Sulfolobus sp. S-194]